MNDFWLMGDYVGMEVPRLARLSGWMKRPHVADGTGSFYPRANPEAEPMGSYGSRCFPGFVEVTDGQGGMEWRLPESVAIPVLLEVFQSVG